MDQCGRADGAALREQEAQILAPLRQRNGQWPDDRHYGSRGQIPINALVNEERAGQELQPGSARQDQGAADDGAPAE